MLAPTRLVICAVAVVMMLFISFLSLSLYFFYGLPIAYTASHDVSGGGEGAGTGGEEEGVMVVEGMGEG